MLDEQPLRHGRQLVRRRRRRSPTTLFPKPCTVPAHEAIFPDLARIGDRPALSSG